MADLEVRRSVGSPLVKWWYMEFLKAPGLEVGFLKPGHMADGLKPLSSFVDPFSEVPCVVEEEDGDFKLPDSNLKDYKLTGPFNMKALSTSRSAVVVVPALATTSWIKKVSVEKAVVVVPPKKYPSCVSTVELGVDSSSKYMEVESFDLVDSLQRHVKAKYCCCFGLGKCMGVDGFEHSCVDVHACYKGTLPWLAPRGPRISKLSRTDTAAAAAAPAPSRPFSFRASLTLSLSVFFE